MLDFTKKIIAVDVYLQRKKSRVYVGRLLKENKSFVFSYYLPYIYKRQSIALGPDLPLSEKKFSSKTLFPTFADRIPSHENPAYPEYCKMVGIDLHERDEIILLSTLGHKGPSSFIFVPVFENVLNAKKLLEFRKKLNLSIREFSDLFDFSPATIHRIETNKTSGKDAFKRLEIYLYFPEIALYEAKKNKFKINDAKSEEVINILTGLKK